MDDINLLETPWYDAINESGRWLSDQAPLVELPDLSTEDRSSLSAAESSGWSSLLWSLRSEAQLSTVGVLFARIELLRAFKARRYLIAATEGRRRKYIRRVFIIGAPRNGTSSLIRSLSNVNGAVSARTHEILDPATTAMRRPDIVRSFTIQDRMWDAVNREFTHQHLNRADLPSECLPILSAGFHSPHWTGCYAVPSYREYLRASGYAPGFRFHDAFSQVIERHHPGQLQIFKSPAYGPIISELHCHYPDAKFIFIDSEPARPLASHIRLIENIRTMRSDKVDREETLRDVVADFCDMYTELAKGVESGTLDENNLRILRYNDLTSNTDLTWWDELLDWLRLQANRLPQQSSRHHRSLFVRLEPRQLAPTAPTPEIASAIVGVRNARRPFVSAIRDTLGKEL